MSQCKASETAACCCMDVGTIIDNTDCRASYSQLFTSEAEARQTLARLTEKARQVESSPCQISAELVPCEQGVRLDADFLFDCQAEALIFQLGLR